ncbi:MAG: hypothetical protein IKP26_07095 [Clostridia bacterium]|nr:hypothetical protein [Clostridia bacterium]
MKRTTALILAALMMITCLAAFPAAAWENEKLQAITLKGSGTEDEPYEVSSASDLAQLSRAVNSGRSTRGEYFAMTCDIDMTGAEFEPIGCSDTRIFSGSFDGRGHTISGLVLDTGRDHTALFGYSNGAIENITLRDSFIRGGDHTAGIVGFGSAENCVNHADIQGRAHVGGIAGEGSVYDCVNCGSVTGESRVGGVIGTGDAYRCVNGGSVSGRTYAHGISGLGVSFDCESTGDEREELPPPDRAKQSVASFIRWGMKRIDASTIPTNANLFVSQSNCGTSPWEYLYGSVRVTTSQTTLNSFFKNNYTKYMTRAQYDEIVEDWSRSTYACDCQGLLDAYMTYEAGISTDINVQMNYSDWCTSKGEIASITRPWVVGEAVFVYSRRLGKMGHIGWVCGFDEDGQPLIMEARGLYFGVVVTRLADRSWTHRGLMTVKFNYDASMSSTWIGDIPNEYEDEELPLYKDDAPVSRAIWDGTVGSSYAGGSGTESDPYLISNGKQLAYLAKKVNDGTSYSGKFFKMTQDIWLNDTDGWTDWDYFNPPANEWTPIGSYTTFTDYHAFKGSFDGGGNTVYGVFFSHNRKGVFGLFGVVGPNPDGCIKNLTIARSYMEAVDNVGAVAGYMTDYGSVLNCHNLGKVRCDHWAGGIVGFISKPSGTTYVKYCSNQYYVKGATDAGGIVGRAHENCVISQCVNTGNYVRSYERTGGIVGQAASTIIEKCGSSCDIRGAYYKGGIVGIATGCTVRQCWNGHNIDGGFKCGGIAASTVNGSITDCFNTGNVSNVEKAGGIAGIANGTAITNVYNVGSVSARRGRGGILSVKSGSTVLTNAFMLEGSSPYGTEYGTYLPDQAFGSTSSYTGFDFENVWIIDPATEYPFAELRNCRYTSSIIPDYDPPVQPTPTPTATPEMTPLPTPPVTPTPEPTPAPTDSPAPIETPAPTDSPAPIETPVPTDSPAPIETPAPTDSPAPIETPVPTDDPTESPEPTAAPTPTPSLSEPPVPSDGPAEPVCGDADGNGVVDTTDALILLRCALELEDPADYPFLMQGDLNGDGEITTEDALLVLRLALGVSGNEPAPAE